jgi:hypothetical protein
LTTSQELSSRAKLGAFFAPNEVEGPAFVFAHAAEP